MLPLVTTKTTVRNRLKLIRAMNTSLLYSAQNELFSVKRGAMINLPGERADVEFESTCVGVNWEQKLFVGVMATEVLSLSESCPGLAVSISPGCGMVMDLINGMGVIGYLDDAPFKSGVDLEVSIQLDIIGRVCIPKIKVGDETMLHPALQMSTEKPLSGLVGHTLTSGRTVDFENPQFRVHTGETARS